MPSNNPDTQDSPIRTIVVAFLVTIISSILVSTAVVALRPLQSKNINLDKKRNVLLAIGKAVEKNEIEQEFSKFTALTVELATGEVTDAISPDKYDLKNMLKSPDTSRMLINEEDIAGIRMVPKYQIAYIFKKDDQIEYLVLPVYGKGLWSTMYGFLALEKDLNTVKGLTFYEHGETPGLGGEIENPQWESPLAR